MTPSTIENDVVSVGPQDVDAPGDLAPKVVKSQEAHELIKQVRANYPIDLVILEQRDEDRARTAALDADEVLDAAQEAFGDAEQQGGVVKVLSARVRGKAQPIAEKAVCVLWETPSGRTARGAVGYAPLTTSIDDFDRRIAAGELTEVDESDAKDLKRTVERQEEQITRLNARLASGEAGDPTEGTGLTQEDVEQMIKSALGDKAAEVVEEAQAQVTEKDEEIERLKAELAEKDAAGDGQPAKPETTDPGAEDAADGTGAGSKTDAEAAAKAAAQADPEPVDAPQGKQQELLAAMDTYSVPELDALIAAEKAGSRPRKKVIAAADDAKQKLEAED